MDSNAMEKSTNTRVFLHILIWWFTDSPNLWSCGSISLKIVLIFLVNFLHFSCDTFKKESIINLGSYRSKSYASVVLIDCKATFLREEGGYNLFSISLLYFVYRQPCIIEEGSYQISLYFTLLGGFRRDLQLFCFYLFSTSLSSSSVNCPSLMFSWLSIIFVRGLSMTLGGVKQILEIFCPLLYSFFFAGSF